MVPLLHHFQPIWIKTWWDFFPVCNFHFGGISRLINSRQSKYPKPVFFFFYVFQLSVFSHTLFGRCPARKLLRLMNIWESYLQTCGIWSIHIISLYIVSLFFLSSVFQFLIIWMWYLITSWLNYLLSFNFDLFLNCYQKDVKKFQNELWTDI